MATYRTTATLRRSIDENASTVRTAGEVKAVLLDQRGLVSAYFLDRGESARLDRLQDKRNMFDHWPVATKASGNTPEEGHVLSELERAYVRYDGKRDEAVSLFDQGQEKEAAVMLVKEVPRHFEETKSACEALIVINTRYLDAVVARGQAEGRQVRTGPPGDHLAGRGG